jgi:hypothetical protein
MLLGVQTQDLLKFIKPFALNMTPLKVDLCSASTRDAMPGAQVQEMKLIVPLQKMLIVNCFPCIKSVPWHVPINP